MKPTKLPTILAAALAATLLSLDANADGPNGPSYSTEAPPPVAALAWRCGKNNPAMWGSFGNGCLKQKRQWGKNSAAIVGDGGEFAAAIPQPEVLRPSLPSMLPSVSSQPAGATIAGRSTLGR